MQTLPDPPEDRGGREPILNVPFLPALIAASMPVLYFFQERLADGGLSMAFRAIDLQQGRWSGLFTTMLLHGGWVHAAMNAVGALTFGAPVARQLKGAGGGVGFLLLYTAGGAIGALGYGLCHPGSQAPLVGASGAVFALVGAATRLMGGHGRVMPLTDPGVVRASLAWMGVNLVVGLVGLAPGAEGARIAWEAHAFGFVVGLLSIGALDRLFGGHSRFDLDRAMSDPRD